MVWVSAPELSKLRPSTGSRPMFPILDLSLSRNWRQGSCLLLLLYFVLFFLILANCDFFDDCFHFYLSWLWPSYIHPNYLLVNPKQLQIKNTLWLNVTIFRIFSPIKYLSRIVFKIFKYKKHFILIITGVSAFSLCDWWASEWCHKIGHAHHSVTTQRVETGCNVCSLFFSSLQYFQSFIIWTF